jgi:hypothetical protein
MVDAIQESLEQFLAPETSLPDGFRLLGGTPEGRISSHRSSQ